MNNIKHMSAVKTDVRPLTIPFLVVLNKDSSIVSTVGYRPLPESNIFFTEVLEQFFII